MKGVDFREYVSDSQLHTSSAPFINLLSETQNIVFYGRKQIVWHCH
jgi:hypothetical protein